MPNGFRFTEILSSSELRLPQKSGLADGQLKGRIGDTGNLFSAFVGSVLLTRGGSVFFHALDENDKMGIFELVLDLTQTPPVPTALRKVVGEGDTLADGRVVTNVGVGDANSQGTYATVIGTVDQAPGVYVRGADGTLGPLFNLFDKAPGGAGTLGGAFGDLSLNDNGDLMVVSAFVPDGSIQSQQGVFFLQGGDPKSDQSFLVLATGELTPDMALVPTDGIGLVQLNNDGNFVVQTGVQVTLTATSPTPLPVTPSPSPSDPPVEFPKADTLILDPPFQATVAGGSVQFRSLATLTGNPEQTDVSTQVTWSSDDPDVATVDSAGKVTVADSAPVGQVLIRASTGDLSATGTLNVQLLSLFAFEQTTQSVVSLTGPDLLTPTTAPSQGVTGSSQFTLDAQGRLYVADLGGNRIVRFDDMTGANPVFLTGATGNFNNPVSVAVDSENRLYVVAGNRLLRFDAMDGSGRRALTHPSFTGLRFVFVAFGGLGPVYLLSATSLHQMLDITGAALTTMTGLVNARSVFVDLAGQIYVAHGSTNPGEPEEQIQRFQNIQGANPVTMPVLGPQAVFVDQAERIFFTTLGSLTRVRDISGADPFFLGAFGPITAIYLSPFTPPPPPPVESPQPRGEARGPGTVLVTGRVKEPASYRLAVAPDGALANPAMRALSPREGGIVSGSPEMAGRLTTAGQVATVITLADGTRQLVVGGAEVTRSGAISPRGARIITIFSVVSGGPTGLVYYQVGTDVGMEVVVFDGAQSSTVLARGDTLNGKVVNSTIFGMMRDGADGDGRLALQIEYDDQSSGLILAEPI